MVVKMTLCWYINDISKEEIEEGALANSKKLSSDFIPSKLWKLGGDVKHILEYCQILMNGNVGLL